MRLWDEKGKVFGLINPVDLLVILIIFAVGVKVLWEFRPAPFKLRENRVTVGLLIKNVPVYLGRSITVGQDLFLDGADTYLGKIRRKQTEPAVLLLQKDGELLLGRSPRDQDLRLEIGRSGEVLTGPGKNGIYLGRLAVRVGDSLRAHTLYTSIKTEIEYIKVK